MWNNMHLHCKEFLELSKNITIKWSQLNCLMRVVTFPCYILALLGYFGCFGALYVIIWCIMTTPKWIIFELFSFAIMDSFLFIDYTDISCIALQIMVNSEMELTKYELNNAITNSWSIIIDYFENINDSIVYLMSKEYVSSNMYIIKGKHRLMM